MIIYIYKISNVEIQHHVKKYKYIMNAIGMFKTINM